MKAQWSRGRSRCWFALALAAMLLALLTPGVTSLAATTQPVRRLASGGFGEGDKNSYSWSMAWFKGKLYVGTARSQLCVENATVDFYYGRGYSPQPAPDLQCPPDRYDLDLRAEIWQYTPSSNAWKMVYQAPADIPNPREPGKFVSRDIAYRGMTVYTEPDGRQALYVGGVTADEYIPEIAAANPPRILRTVDGKNFTAIPGPGFVQSPSGSQRAMGFRSLTPYHGRLYVTATPGLTGDGAIMEVRDPAGPHPQFVQVSPASMQVFEMQVFNGQLYVGAGSSSTGYSVWRTDAKGSPARFVPIVTGGGGRGSAIASVVSMSTFQNRLYVGSSGWNSVFPGSELIRISADDRWDVVVGNPRFADGSFRWPASGLFDGFGNIFNAHFWRMSPDRGGLYLGTNDWSWAARNFPILDGLLRPGYGFDLYGTCDGTTWTAETTNAFGDGLYNFGLRTMVSSKQGFFMGSANQAQGTSVWTEKRAGCAQTGSISSQAPARLDALLKASATKAPAAAATRTETAAPPTSASATSASCGSVVSWQPSPGATRYIVSRSADKTITGVALEPPPRLPDGFRLPSAPEAVSSPTAAISVPAPYARVAVTTKTTYVDRSAKPGIHYQYKITPENGSSPGPVSAVVGQTPPTTATQVRSQIASLAADGQLSGKQAGGLRSLLTAVEKAPRVASDQATALRSLGDAVQASGATSAAAADLGATVYSLAQSMLSARQGCGG